MLKFLSAALCVLTFSSEAAFARGDRGKDLVVSNFDYLGCSARGVIEASTSLNIEAFKDNSKTFVDNFQKGL